MEDIIKIGESGRDENKNLLFVGMDSALALTNIPAKQWPFTINYAATHNATYLQLERNISNYIIKNNSTIGAIVWDPLNDSLIAAKHRLGEVYTHKVNPHELASKIINTLKIWSSHLTYGKIIFIIPHVADIYRLNTYFKYRQQIQIRRQKLLSENMKEAHQTYEIILEQITGRIATSFPTADTNKIIILEFKNLIPDWCRNKIQLQNSLVDENVLYPPLHQNYSNHGVHIGNTQLAGDIFCSFLKSKLLFLSPPTNNLPDITNFEKYLKNVLGVVHYKLYVTNKICNSDRKRLNCLRSKLKAKDLKKALQHYTAASTTSIESTSASQPSSSIAGPSSAGSVIIDIPASHVTIVEEVSDDDSRPVSPIIPPPPKIVPFMVPTKFRNFITPIRFDIEQPDEDVPLPVARIVTEKPDIFFPEFRCLQHDNLRIAILGHSFVTNLERIVSSKPTTFSCLRCFAHSGAKLFKNGKFHFQTYDMCHRWFDYRPHLTFIVMGGNDIEKVADADKLFQLYKTLTNLINWEGTYMSVAVETRFTTRGFMSPKYFNYTVGKLNTLLYRDSPRRYVALPPQIAQRESRKIDGVHLTDKSNEDLRHTILFHLRSVANIA
jgi:hypothetical protein